MKTALLATRNTRAFTLVELLTVIAIIGLLLGMLLPGILAVREASRRTRAKAEIRTIENAIKLYYNDYTKWPTNLVGYDTGSGIETTTTGIEVKGSVIKMLSGSVASDPALDAINPRRKTYLETPSRVAKSPDGSFLDPWGNPYKYMCDFDYDGTLEIQNYTNLPNVGVGVWSMGRDLKDDTAHQKDDQRTWE